MISSIAFVLIAMLQAGETVPNLNLTCVGGGVAKIQTGTSANASDNYGNSVTITGTRSDVAEYRSTTDFRILGGEARIRMPAPLLPAIRGGDDGWFKVKNLKITDATYSGKAAVNFINNPEFSINRFNGTINVTSKNGSFTGTCEAYDDRAKQKF